VFLNLSNHPLATWSADQRVASRALDLGEPTDLPSGMPLVDPQAGPAEVLAQAGELAARAVALGARGAFVAGEHSLSFAVVAELQRRGVRCFVATTQREAVEQVQPDGSVRRVRPCFDSSAGASTRGSEAHAPV
jgi:hypothetical protein